ncbi:LOW QUALITY PROTEIN: sodium/bile acid cotransporter 5 [Thomomys bottae]
MTTKLFIILLFVILGEAKKSFISFLNLKQMEVLFFFEKTEETLIIRSSYRDKQLNSSYLLVKFQDPKVLHLVNVTKKTSDVTSFKINLLIDQEGETNLTLQLWDSEGRQKRLIEEIKNVRVNVRVKVYKPSKERPIQAPVHVNRNILMLILSMILLNMCAFGCKIEFQVLTVWRRPLPVIIGAVTQFFLVAFCGFLLSQILALPEAQAFGFLNCTCLGGGGGYLFALLLDGDVSAILMTCTSTSMALIMMPINSYIYSRLLGLSGVFHIPVFKIVSALLFILTPVSVGVIITRKTPEKANLLERIIRPLSFLLTLVGICLTFMGSVLLKSAHLEVLLLCVLVPALGLLLGYSSNLCLLPLPVCKTVAFESAMQNSFLAFAIIQFSFLQPEANLASVTPFTVALCSGCEMLLLLLVYRAKKRGLRIEPITLCMLPLSYNALEAGLKYHPRPADWLWRRDFLPRASRYVRKNSPLNTPAERAGTPGTKGENRFLPASLRAPADRMGAEAWTALVGAVGEVWPSPGGPRRRGQVRTTVAQRPSPKADLCGDRLEKLEIVMVWEKCRVVECGQASREVSEVGGKF